MHVLSPPPFFSLSFLSLCPLLFENVTEKGLLDLTRIVNAQHLGLKKKKEEEEEDTRNPFESGKLVPSEDREGRGREVLFQTRAKYH